MTRGQMQGESRGGLAKLTRLAIRRPVGTSSIAAVIVIIGLFALSRLPVDLLPNIEYPQIRVTVTYPGVAPEVMEEQVARVIERGLAGTENLTRIESRVRQGRADVDLTFQFGVDLDFALQDAARNLEQVRNRLPDDIDTPRIRKFDAGREAVWRGGFMSTVRSEAEVTDWVENELAPRVLMVEGVSAVEAIGGMIREITVQVDAERLSQFGVTMDSVSHALSAENVDVSAGRLTSSSFDIQATTIGLFRSLDDIRQVLVPLPRIPTAPSGYLRIAEIADVQDGAVEQRVFARLNGVPAAQVDVFKQPDANTVAVADAVAALLADMQESGFIPEDINFSTTQDPTFFIRGAISGVATAAVLGGVLAMGLILLFLGSLRKGFIIGLSIPVALSATFALMNVNGLTLNIISLGGLALGVGLLLDNAIVMLENIFRHREDMGKSADQAAEDGASEVVSAVTAGTLTNLAAVTPFFLITGAAALVFNEMILTISFAIMATLIAALTIVPMLAAVMGRIRRQSGLADWKMVRQFSRLIKELSNRYRRLLPGVLRWRWAVLLMAGVLMVGAMILFGQLGREFLPALDDGQVRVRISLPPGTPPDETLDMAREVEALLRENPYVETVFTLAGGALWGGTVSENSGVAQFLVQLVPRIERPGMSAGRWIQQARQEVQGLDLPGARIGVRPPAIRGLRFTSGGDDVVIGIIGPELVELERLGREVMARLENVSGLEGLEAGDEDRAPRLEIRIDRERAARVGLGVIDVGQVLRTAVDGRVATRFMEGGREYDVRVRLRREDVSDADRLASLIIHEDDGQFVLLSDVAQFELADSPATIWRENQSRIVRVTGDINTTIADVSTVIAGIESALNDMTWPEGYAMLLGGEWETIQDTNRELRIVIGLAIILVFTVMAVQYERLTNPLVILMSAPLSLIGVTGMLWITGTTLSAPALIGLVLLIGIVVNNAILLVEYIEAGRRERGLDVESAIVEAGSLRLRPILMTTLTTVLGMTPLAIGIGEGAEIMQPLAIAVIGGLSVSMLLTLFVVPCLYRILNRPAGVSHS